MTAPIVSDLPPAPQRGESEFVFVPKANAFVAAQSTLVSEVNSLGTWMNDTAVEVEADRADAENSKNSAFTAAFNAAASANQKGIFIPASTTANLGETWQYPQGVYWVCNTNGTTTTPADGVTAWSKGIVSGVIKLDSVSDPKFTNLQEGQTVYLKEYHSNSGYGGGLYEVLTVAQAESRGIIVDGETIGGITVGVNHYCGPLNSLVLVMQYEEQIQFTRAGGIKNVTSDAAAAANAALIVKICNTHNKQMLLTGAFEISRLPAPLVNKVKCVGLVGLSKICGFKVRGTDYITSPLPFINANEGLEFTSMFISQNWKYLVTPPPVGENVDDFAQSWGGFWIVESLTPNSETTLTDFHFVDVQRGVLTNANYIECRNITADTVESATQCLVAGDTALRYYLSNINIVGPKWSTTPYYMGYPVVGGSAFFGRDVTDLQIDGYKSTGHQLVIQGVNENGVQRNGIVRGLYVDETRADTSFRYFRELSISGFEITNSLDMGLTTEGCTSVNISDGIVGGTAIGSIALNGSDTVNVSNVVCKDWGRGDVEAQLFNRFASGGGAWLSPISISFKAGADAANDISLSNVTGRFDYIPPLYDGNPNAPAVTVSGDGTGAEIAIVTYGGVIDEVVIVNGGSGYTAATLTVVAGAVGGAGGALTATLTGGAITSVSIDNAGGSYGDNSVRKAAFGVFVEPTLGTNSTVRMNNVRMPDMRGSGMPNVFNIASDYRMGSSSISTSPAPASGERFTDASGNTFIFISSQSGTVFLKSLKGAISSATVFTGTTGATIVTGNPDTNLIWLGTINVGNLDFTSIGPDGY